jgi:hypothetical protein
VKRTTRIRRSTRQMVRFTHPYLTLREVNRREETFGRECGRVGDPPTTVETSPR